MSRCSCGYHSMCLFTKIGLMTHLSISANINWPGFCATAQLTFSSRSFRCKGSRIRAPQALYTRFVTKMKFASMRICLAPEAGDAAGYLLEREWTVATFASLFVARSPFVTKIEFSSPDPGINQDPHPDAVGRTHHFRHQVRAVFEPQPAVCIDVAVPSRFL